MRSPIVDDRRVVEGAMGSQTSLVIHLGPKEAAVYSAILTEYESKGGPLSAVCAAEIVQKIAPSQNPYSMLNGLEAKGALQSSEDKSKNRLRIPRTRGVIILSGSVRNPKQIHPPLEQAPATPLVSEAKEIKEKKGTRKIEEGTPWKAPEGSEKIFSGAFIMSPNASPISLTRKRASVYEKLITWSRQGAYQTFNPEEVCDIVALAGILSPSNIVSLFDHELQLFVRVAGTLLSKKDPCLRALVFRPYVCTDVDEVIVPEECKEHSDVVQNVPVATQDVVSKKGILSKKALQLKVAELRQSVSERFQQASEARTQHQRTLEELHARVVSLREQYEAAEDSFLNEEKKDPGEHFERQADALRDLADRKQKLVDQYDDLIADLMEE